MNNRIQKSDHKSDLVHVVYVVVLYFRNKKEFVTVNATNQIITRVTLREKVSEPLH